MKIYRNNIVSSIVLLIGILLSYNIYFQQGNSPMTIEITAESGSKSNCLSSDSEVHAEDKISNSSFYLTFESIGITTVIAFITPQTIQRSFTIWQPPEIN